MMRSRVEAVGTCRIVLSSGFVLGLERTVYVPSFSKHLILLIFDTCIACIKGKQINKSKKGAKRSSDILEIIHADICSPSMDLYGQKYFITFIDDYSRYMYLYITDMKHLMPLRFLRLK